MRTFSSPLPDAKGRRLDSRALPPFGIDKHMSCRGACSPPTWFWLAGAHRESADSVGPCGAWAGSRIDMKRYIQYIRRGRRVLSVASLS